MVFNTFSTAVEFRAVQPALHSTHSTNPFGFRVATKFWRITVPVKCNYNSRPRGAWYDLHWILQKIVPVSCFWLCGGRVDEVFNNKVRGLDRIIQVTVCWGHILSRRRLPIRPTEPQCVQRVYYAAQCAVARPCLVLIARTQSFAGREGSL